MLIGCKDARMKMRLIVPLFAASAFLMCQAGNAQPEPPTIRVIDVTIPAVEIQCKDKTQPPDKKKQPDKKDPDKKDPAPEQDLFTRTPTMGEQFPTGFNPNMLGDFGLFFAKQTITITGTKT